MDANVEILIRDVNVDNGLSIEKRVFHWGGEEHVDKVVYHWGTHFTLESKLESAPSYVLGRLDIEFGRGVWRYLSILGDGLDLFEGEVNGESVEWGGMDLEGLLRTQLGGDREWAIAFVWQSDRIDEVLELDVDGVLERLRRNLLRDVTPTGFLAFHRRSRS